MAVVAQLKVFHPSQYSELSKRLERDNIVVYCNDYYDMVVVEGRVTDDIVKEVKDLFDKSEPINFTENPGNPLNYMIISCSCEGSWQLTSDYILRNQGIRVAPIIYSDGWEYHKFVCTTKSILSNIMNDLQKFYTIELISVEERSYYNPLDFFGISAGKIHRTLSENQIKLLVQAYQQGYYKTPRDTNLDELAADHNISRAAVGRAIRKAENKIMDMIIPLLDVESNLQELLSIRA